MSQINLEVGFRSLNIYWEQSQTRTSQNNTTPVSKRFGNCMAHKLSFHPHHMFIKICTIRAQANIVSCFRLTIKLRHAILWALWFLPLAIHFIRLLGPLTGFGCLLLLRCLLLGQVRWHCDGNKRLRRQLRMEASRSSEQTQMCIYGY